MKKIIYPTKLPALYKKIHCNIYINFIFKKKKYKNSYNKVAYDFSKAKKNVNVILVWGGEILLIVKISQEN